MDDMRRVEIAGEFLRIKAKEYVDLVEHFPSLEIRVRELVAERKKTKLNTKKYLDYGLIIDIVSDKMSTFLDAEHFVFSSVGTTTAESFIEDNGLPIDIDYYRRMVREGRVLMNIKKKGMEENVNNKRKESDETGLLDGNDRKGRMFGGCNSERPSGTGFGDSETSGRQATALAGCVC